MIKVIKVYALLLIKLYDNLHNSSFFRQSLFLLSQWRVNAYQKSKMMFCLCLRVESCTNIIDTQIKLQLLRKYPKDDWAWTFICTTFRRFLRFLQTFLCFLLSWTGFRETCSYIGMLSIELSKWNWAVASETDFFYTKVGRFPSTHGFIFLCKLSLWDLKSNLRSW